MGIDVKRNGLPEGPKHVSKSQMKGRWHKGAFTVCCYPRWYVFHIFREPTSYVVSACRSLSVFIGCNFERVHPIVLILMYWIYLLPSTQQTIGYNDFITTCFDSHESSSGYVQNLLVLAVLLLTVLELVGRYEVVAVLALI
jgi:hypothetical protein